MTYKIPLRVGGMDALSVLLNSNPKELKLSFPLSKPNKSGMANDDAENILNMVVEFSRDLDISLLAVWLCTIVEMPDGKKTTIKGRAIPSEQAELAALLVELTEKQQDGLSEDKK